MASGLESPPAEEARFGLAPDIAKKIEEALEAGRTSDIHTLISPLHVADIADLIESLPDERRRMVMASLDADVIPEVLSYLDEVVREDLLESLEPEQVAKAITKLDSDDAVDLIETLEPDEQREVLDAVPAEERAQLEDALQYPEDTAGRLMQRELVAVPIGWTVGDTIDFTRTATDLASDFYDVYIIDAAHKPLGAVPLSRVLRSSRDISLADIMDRELRLVPATMDQEEVAYLFRKYGLIAAPVVDNQGRLVGVITFDDAVRVIEEEAEDDLLKLGGVREDDLYSATVDTTKARMPWLAVNLGTALLSSAVIGLFEGAIERIVALAVLMPIVASMGGNAGTQSLTVAVRALATKELGSANARRVLGKEVLVGLANGLTFALLTGAVAWIWFRDIGVGTVLAMAMIANLMIAAFMGVTIPLVLERLKIDPAVASGVFLTAITDVVGFGVFLGLAALFLL
ncbi:MAG: magnesium transporter [Alphaproteobacteria bacterium]